MERQPLVTFIVTTYNLPTDLLRQSLESILALSLGKWQREIIVIDDGSEISPINALGDIIDDIVYLRQPNQGLSVARNTGIRNATGKFIQFVDGDDCLIQPGYEHVLDILRYNEHVDMVLFQISNSKNQTIDFNYSGPTTGTHYMENNNVRASACGYVFRADCLGDLRFTPGIYHEDEEFTPQLILRMQNLYTTEAKAYYYRVRKDSITHSYSEDKKEKRLDDTLGVILRLQEMASGIGDTEKEEALDRRISQLSMDYLINVIRLTKSLAKINEATKQLAEHGLYPLPDRHYTKKYALFCKMIQNKFGRIILKALL